MDRVPLRSVQANLVYTFSYTGNLAEETLLHRLYNDSGADRTIRSVRASVGITPSGSGIIVNVYCNGDTIFTAPDHPVTPWPGEHPRPYIKPGLFTDVTTPRSDFVWGSGDYLTVSIDQIGSTIAGADLTISVVVAE